MNDETESALSLFQGQLDTSCFSLVVLWHREKQDCVGAAAFIPEGSTCRLGRGRDPDLGWLQPSQSDPLNSGVFPFDVSRISRHQLDIRADAQGLYVRNVGRCELLVDGKSQPDGWIQPGQVLALGQEVLLLVEIRQVRPFSAIPEFSQPFGTVDSWGWIGESPATWRVRKQLWMTRSTDGHVLVRGAPGTGRARVARGLDAIEYLWSDAGEVPEHGNLWVSDPDIWLAERPAEALALLKTLKAAGRRMVITIDPAISTLDFKHEALFPNRLELPGLPERLSDIGFIATHSLRQLAHELPKAAESVVNGRPLLTPEWMLFMIHRHWSSHEAELRTLLLDAVHRSENGWLVPPAHGRSELPTEQPALPPVPSHLNLSDCIVDFERREVIRGDERIRLTPLEIRVLQYFSQRVDREITKEDLFLGAWGIPYPEETRALKNTIRRLRQKIEPDRENPAHLKSVWGIGYRFMLPS